MILDWVGRHRAIVVHHFGPPLDRTERLKFGSASVLFGVSLTLASLWANFAMPYDRSQESFGLAHSARQFWLCLVCLKTIIRHIKNVVSQGILFGLSVYVEMVD